MVWLVIIIIITATATAAAAATTTTTTTTNLWSCNKVFLGVEFRSLVGFFWDGWPLDEG